ncbi:Copine [Teladorsagia circumcincta]|uniref:Copine n=1 Tax=Teladorsagia circumcincta TaxID=45464 RepID=A0A2G9TTC9_TELCI|nr:Copine [Teladorsagia circumcincta]
MSDLDEFYRYSTILNFAFAIDFSDADGAQDHESQVNFTDNVEFAIRSIGDTFADYNRTNAYTAYGFGARIPPFYRESHEFCLNLETDPTCTGVDGVVTAFRNTYMQAQPCTSAQFSHVIYHVAKLAQIHATRTEQTRPQYHILNIITRGAIDDVKETVQAAIFSSKSPISVIFTGIGDRNLDEIERLGAGGKRLIFQGRRTDRDNLHYVNMTRVLLESDGSADESKLTLSEKSLFQIPRQIATYFTKNGILPMERRDNPAAENPMETVYRSSPALENDDYEPYGRGAIDQSSHDIPVTAVPSYVQENYESVRRKPPSLNRNLRSMTITGDGGRRY